MQTDEALGALDQAVRRGFWCVPALLNDTYLEPVRCLSAFPAVLSEAEARAGRAAKAFVDAGRAARAFQFLSADAARTRGILITRDELASQIRDYLQHRITHEALVEWAEKAMMDEEFDAHDFGTLRTSSFDSYESLLKLGHEAGKRVRFAEPEQASALRWTIADSAKARPGIRVSELESLLNLEPETARLLAERAIRDDNVIIQLDSVAASRSRSTRPSHDRTWFQLAPVWTTSLNSSPRHGRCYH